MYRCTYPGSIHSPPPKRTLGSQPVIPHPRFPSSTKQNISASRINQLHGLLRSREPRSVLSSTVLVLNSLCSFPLAELKVQSLGPSVLRARPLKARSKSKSRVDSGIHSTGWTAPSSTKTPPILSFSTSLHGSAKVSVPGRSHFSFPRDCTCTAPAKSQAQAPALEVLNAAPKRERLWCRDRRQPARHSSSP